MLESISLPLLRRRLATALALLAAAGTYSPAALAEEDVRRLIEESRKASLQVLQQIRSELVKELEASGPLRAIIVCKYTAPEITSNVARKTGWKVTRVSLKPRNPALGTPDSWEQKVLFDFEQRAGRGDKNDAMEHHEIVSEPTGRYFRYMRAIPTVPLCAACHGPAETLTEAVKAQLAAEYPFDRAVGYSVGQIRGAVTVKRPVKPGS